MQYRSKLLPMLAPRPGTAPSQQRVRMGAVVSSTSLRPDTPSTASGPGILRPAPQQLQCELWEREERASETRSNGIKVTLWCSVATILRARIIGKVEYLPRGRYVLYHLFLCHKYDRSGSAIGPWSSNALAIGLSFYIGIVLIPFQALYRNSMDIHGFILWLCSR